MRFVRHVHCPPHQFPFPFTKSTWLFTRFTSFQRSHLYHQGGPCHATVDKILDTGSAPLLLSHLPRSRKVTLDRGETCDKSA